MLTSLMILAYGFIAIITFLLSVVWLLHVSLTLYRCMTLYLKHALPVATMIYFLGEPLDLASYWQAREEINGVELL